MNEKPYKNQNIAHNDPPKTRGERGPKPLSDSVKTRRLTALAFQEILKKSIILEQALMQQADFNTLERRDRAFARAIVATSFRRFGQIEAALKPFIRKKPPEFVRAVLHSAAAQILFLKTPAHAAVGESVEILKLRADSRGFANMANAVLRNIAKDGGKIAAQTPPSANIPPWIRRIWGKHYGAPQMRKLALCLTKDPVLDLSVKGDASFWAEKLGGIIIGPQSVRLPAIGDVTALEGYEQGHWWVQDVAATLPAQIAQQLALPHNTELHDTVPYDLAPPPPSDPGPAPASILAGLSVLDLCAAPGGKSLQLAAMGAQVTALDRSKNRLERFAENLTRTQLTAQIICEDALDYQMDQQFDIILLDAPCSATGTFRRHPDVLYNCQPKIVSELVKIQRKLLRRAASWLKPQGLLIYSVCSLQPEESEAQIIHFLGDMPDFRRISLTQAKGVDLPETRFMGGTIRTMPSDLSELGGMDGFFIAAMQKTHQD